MSDKIKILYIDDELNNLVGFKALLRLDYQIFTAVNTSDAINYLANHADIRIIFCDQRMPDKTGVEFFEEIRSTCPLPIRILLTAYADIESVINAINRGNVFRYVKKPWIDADIISAINEADKFYVANSLLAVKNIELQKAYTELDKFAYSVSHDIRGPLTGIAGGIDLALNMNSVADMKEVLVLMNQSVSKLESFILSMHEYYSLQRGELMLTAINFTEIINELKEIYKIYAVTGGIAFYTSVEQDESFWSDEICLKLILHNLLSNAFKYQKKESNNKSVSLKIEIKRSILTIEIGDTGTGIHEKHLSDIFNLFFRASSQEAGSGFGLYNVKSALLKLNGKIEVDSQLEIGTVFKVSIPNK